MNAKENWLAVFRGEAAERIPYTWEGVAGPFMDPQNLLDMAPPTGEEFADSWGVIWKTVPGFPGQHPFIKDENVVIKDIRNWRQYVKVPDPYSYDWSEAKAWAESVDRSENLLMGMTSNGIFERSHFLLGMENALIDYMMYPQEMKELAAAIADHKLRLLDVMYENMHPDIFMYNDDWGSMQNVFLPPSLWREIIKPQHARIVRAAHERGMIFIHHADCVCAPYVEDMIEIGIDIWQGIVPENDIVSLQKQIDGRMCLMGGISGPIVDTPDQKESAIRAEVRRAIDAYCPAGRFFPGITSVMPLTDRALDIMRDEIISYGRQFTTRP